MTNSPEQDLTDARRTAREGGELTQAYLDHMIAAGDVEWIEDDTAPDGGAWAWKQQPTPGA